MGHPRRAPSSRTALSLVVVLLAAACAPQASPLPSTRDSTPSASVPDSPAPATSTPGTSANVDATACGTSTGSATTAAVFDAQPEPPTIPGAGPPPSADLNPLRKPPTPVPDGEPATGPQNPSEFVPPGAQDPADPRAVTLLALPRAVGRGSPIAEPEIATAGGSSLITWNWGAAQIVDGGPLRYFDTDTVLDGEAIDNGFCCDQLAQYVAPPYDLWLWVLQYQRVPGERGNNRVRLAVANGATAFAQREFVTYDFTAQQAGFADGIWYDQTKLGVSAGHVFLSINAFGARPPDGDGLFRGAAVLRIPLDQLAAGGPVTTSCFVTRDQPDANGYPLFGPYPVREAGSTMYLATHNDAGELGVWRWRDELPAPSFHVVRDYDEAGRLITYPFELERLTDDNGRPYLDSKYTCERTGVADLPTPMPRTGIRPDDWCRRSDDRLSSAWLAGGRIGFAWNVSQDPDPAGHWRYPYVWVVELDEAALDGCLEGECVVAYPHIRNPEFAFQHARIAPNGRGDLGAVVLFGGGSRNYACAAGVRDRDAATDAGWDLVVVDESRVPPARPVSGDYLGLAPNGGNDLTWTAACMTLDGRAAFDDERTAQVHVVPFGRRGDRPG